MNVQDTPHRLRFFHSFSHSPVQRREESHGAAEQQHRAELLGRRLLDRRPRTLCADRGRRLTGPRKSSRPARPLLFPVDVTVLIRSRGGEVLLLQETPGAQTRRPTPARYRPPSPMPPLRRCNVIIAAGGAMPYPPNVCPRLRVPPRGTLSLGVTPPRGREEEGRGALRAEDEGQDEPERDRAPSHVFFFRGSCWIPLAWTPRGCRFLPPDSSLSSTTQRLASSRSMFFTQKLG